jgi:hypothetical protein
MKLFKLFVVTLIFSNAVSCKKPTLTSSSNVSMDDAASMLSGSLSSNSYGVNNISTDASFSAQTSIATNQLCGSTKMDTLIRQSQPASAATYYYKLMYSHKLTCNISNSPDNITTNLSYAGNFSNSKLSLSNSGTTGFLIAGLTPTATVYAINGEYKSMGTFKLKPDTTNTGSANVDIVIKNLIVTKATQVIASGTATVIVTGTTAKKGDFTYNGTLTFNGNAMATMVINGTTYTVNLTTGDVTKH